MSCWARSTQEVAVAGLHTSIRLYVLYVQAKRSRAERSHTFAHASRPARPVLWCESRTVRQRGESYQESIYLPTCVYITSSVETERGRLNGKGVGGWASLTMTAKVSRDMWRKGVHFATVRIFSGKDDDARGADTKCERKRGLMSMMERLSFYSLKGFWTSGLGNIDRHFYDRELKFCR